MAYNLTKFLPTVASATPRSIARAIALAITMSCIVLSACATAPDITPSAAPAGNYILDPTHASVTWSLSHAGLSQYTARFDDIRGMLNFDPDQPENSSVDIRIDPKSVSTGLVDFDEALATESRYFDSSTYPEIRFISDSVTVTDKNTGKITGNLTLKGVTKPLVLDVTFNGAGTSFGNPGKTLGFSAQSTLIRSEFNMGYLTNFGIGDKVSLRIEAEFNENRKNGEETE